MLYDNISIEDRELINVIFQASTLVSLILDKKFNLQNIFALIVEDNQVSDIFRIITELDEDIEVCRELLKIDSSLLKSKIVTSLKISG